jgi:hypothetical protein
VPRRGYTLRSTGKRIDRPPDVGPPCQDLGDNLGARDGQQHGVAADPVNLGTALIGAPSMTTNGMLYALHMASGA